MKTCRKLTLFGVVLSGGITNVKPFTPGYKYSTHSSFLRSYDDRSQCNIKSSGRFSYPHPSTQLRAWSPFKNNVEEKIVEEEVVATTPGPLDAKNAVAATVWIGLITWAFLFAPGTINSSSDAQMLERLISQPVPRPEEINELWFAVWNTFAVVPAVLAALTAPTGKNQRLSSAPFLLGSAAFGYFALGPYFATRTVQTDPVNVEDLGWASRNIFENKIFAVALLALTISIPFSSDIIVPGFDFSSKATDFANLLSQSRFMSVSTVDITLMSILSSVLISEDCKLRGWKDISIPVSILSLLLPVVGPCAYLVARPGYSTETD